eukprot:scaffold39661_cov63-Cyclotella_meneghiniana.AAC.11
MGQERRVLTPDFVCALNLTLQAIFTLVRSKIDAARTLKVIHGSTDSYSAQQKTVSVDDCRQLGIRKKKRLAQTTPTSSSLIQKDSDQSDVGSRESSNSSVHNESQESPNWDEDADDFEEAADGVDEEQALNEAIKSAYKQCKNPQIYTEEDLETRYVYGLKVLRAAQLAKGAKKKARWLKTLLATPSIQSLPSYVRPLKVSHDQVIHMLSVLSIIHELNRMNENIMFRSLVYLFMIYFKVPDKTRKRKLSEMMKNKEDLNEEDMDEYDWQNLYFAAEFGPSIKVNMKAASACSAVVTTLENLSELLNFSEEYAKKPLRCMLILLVGRVVSCPEQHRGCFEGEGTWFYEIMKIMNLISHLSASSLFL